MFGSWKSCNSSLFAILSLWYANPAHVENLATGARRSGVFGNSRISLPFAQLKDGVFLLELSYH